MRHVPLLTLTLALAALPAQAQIYRCGNLFSQQPCGPDAQRLDTLDVERPILTGPRPPPSAPSAAVQKIAARCAEQWPDDYRMQRYCRDQQLAAARRGIAAGYTSYPEGTPEWKVAARCAEQWRDGDTFDFRMINHCIEQQLQALQELRGD